RGGGGRPRPRPAVPVRRRRRPRASAAGGGAGTGRARARRGDAVTVLLALAVGFLGGRLAWTMLAHTFAHPIFERSNYRGEPVVTAAGVVLPLVLLVVEGGRALAGALGTGTRVGLTGGRTLVLLAVLGFGLLGALDDPVGGRHPRGCRRRR